jgi:pimeloyl-ACP methyl ester carboxylesterase
VDDQLYSAVVGHDGFSTHYLEAAPSGTGPAGTVVLVHDGWYGADARTLWARVVPLLAGEFRVLAPDMLGFGRTDKAVYFDRSMYQYRSAHLASFLRAVSTPDEQPHLVGTSMGGSILLRAVSAAKPELAAASVVSISGSGGPWRSAFGVEQLGRYDGRREDIARVLAHMADDFDGYDDVVAARHQNTAIRGHVECLLAAAVKHPAPAGTRPPADDWPAPLARVQVPVTVVAGRRDPLLEPGWEQHFSGLSELVSVRVVDTKHAPSLDHPELVAELVRDTVRRAGGSARGEVPEASR